MLQIEFGHGQKALVSAGRITSWFVAGGELVVLGEPLDDGEDQHNCDQMGCGQSHVLLRVWDVTNNQGTRYAKAILEGLESAGAPPRRIEPRVFDCYCVSEMGMPDRECSLCGGTGYKPEGYTLRNSRADLGPHFPGDV